MLESGRQRCYAQFPPMNFTRDLHLCGSCKKIFNDLNFFLEHKSQCSSPQISSVVFSPNPHDITLENGLFCNETVLDLTVLDNGSFLPILHCENEEVVSDAAEFQTEEEILYSGTSKKTQSHSKKITSEQVSECINEKEAANLLATQLSTESSASNSDADHHMISDTRVKHARKSLNSELSVKNGNSIVESEHHEGNIVEKNVTTNQSQKNICSICNFVSAYHKDLVRHMRKHTGEKPYSCSVCGKRFARQDKLTTHKRIHAGDKRYKCQLCNYATTDSGALKKHSQIHTDDRPHRCQMCSYRARNASHMTVHLRTHTGDSPFFCQIETCEKTFKTSTDLKRHMKVHKLDTLSPSYSSFDGESDKYSCKHGLKNGKLLVKSPTCLICQDFTHKGFIKRRRGLRKNRGLVAQCVQPHKCSVCSAAFVRPDSLRSHMKLHHLTHDNLESEGIMSPNPHQDARDSSSTDFLLMSSGLQSIPSDSVNLDSSFL